MSLAGNLRPHYQSRTGADVTGHEAGRAFDCAFVGSPWPIGVDRLYSQVREKKQYEEGPA